LHQITMILQCALQAKYAVLGALSPPGLLCAI
jgi:hypothetical protein